MLVMNHAKQNQRSQTHSSSVLKGPFMLMNVVEGPPDCTWIRKPIISLHVLHQSLKLQSLCEFLEESRLFPRQAFQRNPGGPVFRLWQEGYFLGITGWASICMPLHIESRFSCGNVCFYSSDFVISLINLNIFLANGNWPCHEYDNNLLGKKLFCFQAGGKKKKAGWGGGRSSLVGMLVTDSCPYIFLQSLKQLCESCLSPLI